MGADTSYETLTALNPAHLKALLGQEVVVTLGDASTRTGIVYNVDPVNFSVALLKPRRPLIKGTQGENRVPARAPPPRRPATPQIRDVHPRGFPTILDFYLTDRRPPMYRRSFTEGTRRRGSPVRRPRPRGQGRGGGGRTTRGDGVPRVRSRRRVERSIGGVAGVSACDAGFGSVRRPGRRF